MFYDRYLKLSPLLARKSHFLWCKFLLTGSSARKLRRAGVNLLGGRAWWREFFPLTSYEIKNFQLIKYLNTGGLPSVYTSKTPQLELKNLILPVHKFLSQLWQGKII